MTKKFLSFVLSLGAFTFAVNVQSSNQSVSATTIVVESLNPSLHAQRVKIEEKQKEILASANSSKAQALKLNEELRLLKEEYVRMLRAELAKTTDEAVKTELQNEISKNSINPSTH